jgi:hypothetical protein
MQIKVENFAGMLPFKTDALLPDTAATYAQNAWLFHGDLRAFRVPTELHTLTQWDTKSIYRLPNKDAPYYIEGSTWLEFDDPEMMVVRAPMVNDRWDRYYFFSPTSAPQYNTRDRLEAGLPNYLLGIPSPTDAPTVTPQAGTNVTRAYVYTWVSEFGEESAPSIPDVATGANPGTWTVDIPACPLTVRAQRNITQTRIYRTIADGAGGAAYYLVDTVPLATTSYTDSKKDTEISGATQLATTGWGPPPNDLCGAVVLPNGIITGWTMSNDIWFCDPYHPHSWPSSYTGSVEYTVVGMGVMGQSFAILTQGPPYVGTGVHPSTMSITALGAKEACLSRRSIVSSEAGVSYVSQNGLVRLQYGYGAAENLTAQFFSRQQWAALQPQMFMSAKMAQAYLAFTQHGQLIVGEVLDGAISPGTNGTLPADGLQYDGAYKPGSSGLNPDDGIILEGFHTTFRPDSNQGDNGFIFGGAQPQNTTFTYIAFPGLIDNLFQDEYSGEIFIVSDGKIWWWDKPEQPRNSSYVWQSKLFEFPAKQAFIAAKIFFGVPPEMGIPSPKPEERNTSQQQAYDPTRQRLLFRVYAGGKQILVREVQQSGELIMIPGGLKEDFWQFRLEGQVIVQNVQLATSVKELRNV